MITVISIALYFLAALFAAVMGMMAGKASVNPNSANKNDGRGEAFLFLILFVLATLTQIFG